VFPPSLSLCGQTTATTVGGSTTTVIPVTLGSISVGDDIIVVITYSETGGATAATATDDAGNVYTLRQDAATPDGNASETRTASLDSLGVAAVPTSITVTHASAVSRNANCLVNDSGSAIAFFGSTSGTAFPGTSTTTTGSVTGAPPKALVVAGVGRTGTTGWDPDDNNYSQIGLTLTTGAPVRSFDTWWQVRQDSCVPPCAANGDFTSGSTHVYAATIVVYRWGGALPVVMTEFAGQRQGTAARVLWTTRSENKTAGFKIYREAMNGRLVSLTTGVLPSRGDAFSGRSYAFTDNYAPSTSARYWIESIDINGDTSRYGPVHVAPVLSKGGHPGLLGSGDVIEYAGDIAGSVDGLEEVGQ
jgi:hypothetical protein